MERRSVYEYNLCQLIALTIISRILVNYLSTLHKTQTPHDEKEIQHSCYILY